MRWNQVIEDLLGTVLVTFPILLSAICPLCSVGALNDTAVSLTIHICAPDFENSTFLYNSLSTGLSFEAFLAEINFLVSEKKTGHQI